MRLTVSVIATFLLFSQSIYAEEINAGFVQGLWYSEDEIFVDQTTRIYVALRNNTESEITGIVFFKNGTETIARKEISALSGRLLEAWADWTPTYGAHTITAELQNVRLHPVGEEEQSVTTVSGISESLIFVDHDTDGDGIGNEEDEDDDNDGLTDEEEAKGGTDPLVPDAPEEEEGPAEEVKEDTVEAEEVVSDEVSTKEGLEQYFKEGTVDTLLSNVTNKVASSKQSIDAYREKRSASNEVNDEEADSNIVIYETGSSTDIVPATITRSQIDSNDAGFFGAFVSGIKAIANGLYTFILWVISKVFAHPALVQLLLLIGILILVFKLARRLGGRPN